MILLFGMIAAVGIGSLVKNKVDMNLPRNLIIISVILVVGIGNMTLTIAAVNLESIGLAGIVGIFLNLILPGEKNANS